MQASGHSRAAAWRSVEPLTASQCWERAFDWLDEARDAKDPNMRKKLTDLADSWAFLAARRGREEKAAAPRPSSA